MARLMDLLEVEVFAEIGLPNLTEERLSQVQKFTLDVVFIKIRVIWMKIFVCNPVLADDEGIVAQTANDMLLKHAVG